MILKHSPDAEYEDAFVEDYDNANEDESNTDEAEEFKWGLPVRELLAQVTIPHRLLHHTLIKRKRDIRKYEYLYTTRLFYQLYTICTLIFEGSMSGLVLVSGSSRGLFPWQKHFLDAGYRVAINYFKSGRKG